MGVSPKWVKSKKRRKKSEREKEKLNNGDNNGQATHGARKQAWRTQAAWAKNHLAENWDSLGVLNGEIDEALAYRGQ